MTTPKERQEQALSELIEIKSQLVGISDSLEELSNIHDALENFVHKDAPKHGTMSGDFLGLKIVSYLISHYDPTYAHNVLKNQVVTFVLEAPLKHKQLLGEFLTIGAYIYHVRDRENLQAVRVLKVYNFCQEDAIIELPELHQKLKDEFELEIERINLEENY